MNNFEIIFISITVLNSLAAFWIHTKVKKYNGEMESDPRIIKINAAMKEFEISLENLYDMIISMKNRQNRYSKIDVQDKPRDLKSIHLELVKGRKNFKNKEG